MVDQGVIPTQQWVRSTRLITEQEKEHCISIYSGSPRNSSAVQCFYLEANVGVQLVQ